MREELIVNNIKCGGCENTVRTSLAKIEGVSNIEADSTTGRVAFDLTDASILEKVKHLTLWPVHRMRALLLLR